MYLFFIEFSHKLMQKIQLVVTRQENTIRKEKTYDILSNGYKEKTATVQRNYSENATPPNKQNEKRKKRVWLSGRLHTRQCS